MNLRKIELSGFKTFARRTEVDLPGGVTAIVGPNGSGKSNLADALRWVLGEQSMQHIRGKKTEDVIFAGSGNRAPMGMAEVALTLDNTSGWIPLDFSEVTIKRRAFRSGENEYYINGSRVRLKDLTDLRNRAGFGQSSYSVIGQGHVDAILSQRPEERRSLFEEAAGIRHYQSRRDHTLDQLAATQQNLVRANDILAEITPRLASLRHQSEKARQFEEVREELRRVQIRWYAARFRQIAVTSGDADRLLAETQRSLDQAAERALEIEARVNSLEAGRQAVEHSLANQSQRAAEFRRERQRLQGQIDLSRDKLAFIEQQGQDVERELAETAEAQVRLQEQRAAAATEMEALRQETATLETRLHQAEAAAAARVNALRLAQGRFQEARDELVNATATLEQRQQEAGETAKRKQQLLDQSNQHEQDMRRKGGLVSALQEQIQKLQSEAAAIRLEEQRFSGEVEEARMSLTAANQRLVEHQAKVDALRRRHHEVKTRRHLLNELQASMEGVADGAKALIKSKQKGVLGLLAEHLRVKEGFERAIEAALGHKLQTVLVSDDRAALEALQVLPKSGGTVLPGPWAPVQESRPLPPGFTAASTAVQTEHQAVAALLADVIIAPDIAVALAERARLTSAQGPGLGPRPDLRIATLAGEVIDSDGCITRFGPSGGAAVLRRQRELNELSTTLSAVETELAIAEKDAGALQHDIDEQRRALQERSDRLKQRVDVRQQRLNQARDLGQQKQAAQAQIEWLTSLKEQLGNDLRTLELRATGLTAQLDQWAERIPELRSAVQVLELELQTLQAESQSEADRPGQLKLEMGGARQRIEHLAATICTIDQTLLGNERQIATKQKRADERLATLEQLRRDMEGFGKQLVQVERQMQDQEQAIPPLRNRLETVVQEVRALRAEESAARESQVDIDKRLYRLSFDRQRKQDELEGLATALLEELHLTPDLLPEHDPAFPEPSKREVEALKGKLNALGPINPDALGEFQEVSERHAFLTAQTGDLEQASAQLRAVIAELEELTERQFRETFQAVEREFHRFFRMMFGGGEVQLFLTSPEEISLTGVEIMAQPPGKRLQSLAALSGGERALISASLLFAILTVKTVPFCLLDEVDAALDEANVGRFCEALKTLATQTQFVVITHNRETMSMANALYGVSMNQDGVSRLVSLRLTGVDKNLEEEEAEEAAELIAG